MRWMSTKGVAVPGPACRRRSSELFSGDDPVVAGLAADLALEGEAWPPATRPISVYARPLPLLDVPHPRPRDAPFEAPDPDAGLGVREDPRLEARGAPRLDRRHVGAR